jgi:hypothetical protein
VKDFFIDHLTALAAWKDDERKALEEIMSRIGGLVKELNITVYLISHLATPEGKPHEEGGRVMIRHLKGSRSIGFWCHYIFALERDQQAENLAVRLTTTVPRAEGPIHRTGNGADVPAAIRSGDRDAQRRWSARVVRQRRNGFSDETLTNTRNYRLLNGGRCSTLSSTCETNGLYEDVTKVHCLVLRDLEHRRSSLVYNSAPGFPTIEEGLRVLSKAERVYGHNIIDYDIPVLRKLYPDWTPPARALDTLVVARMRWAHIKSTDFALHRKGKLPGQFIGRHSLEAWGFRMGILKGDFGKNNEWEFWSKRCRRIANATRLSPANLSSASAKLASPGVRRDRTRISGVPVVRNSATVFRST